ncbi:thiamine-phosphate kinase [Pontibacter sp. JAM-7]|uniref:thiamine-phosphate kinase n=1 Tax=Pontibacter sp. JAM-7 TaxID=3366581 RepID=UPI003AF512D3
MRSADMGEFELIRQFFVRQSADTSVVLGVGDDCAVLQPVPDQQLVLSIDTLVEGTHFLPDTPPELIARRLMGAAVSDLAAMGAQPAWLTLALTLPKADPAWLAPFADALFDCCQQWGLSLIGGDTTRGPLTVTAQVHGWVPNNEALTRGGARPGDLVLVSGTLGDSRAGLETLLQPQAVNADLSYLQQRFYAPEPRLGLGQSLRGLASSCIDLSDGLVADLGHLLNMAQCGAEIELSKLPLSPQIQRNFPAPTCLEWALSGGEDFELCFTLPEAHLPLLEQQPVTVIGRITSGSELILLHQGKPQPLTVAGFDHFAPKKA